VYIERCKHGSERGWRKPAAETRQGGAFPLYHNSGVPEAVSFGNPASSEREMVLLSIKKANQSAASFSMRRFFCRRMKKFSY